VAKPMGAVSVFTNGELHPLHVCVLGNGRPLVLSAVSFIPRRLLVAQQDKLTLTLTDFKG